MTPKQFERAATTANMDPEGRATQAARKVLVDGLSRRAAATEIGVDIRAVSRAVDRLQPTERCPTCGHHLGGALGSRRRERTIA